MSHTDDQEVVRTIGDIKKIASWNWNSGFITGVGTILGILIVVFLLGLKYNI